MVDALNDPGAKSNDVYSSDPDRAECSALSGFDRPVPGWFLLQHFLINRT